MNAKLAAAMLESNDYLDVGVNTYGAPNIVRFPSFCGKVKIGNYCSIADSVTFLCGGNHYTSRGTTYPFNLLFDDIELPWHEYSKGSIEIGNDVWIGYGATILDGVTIGNGAVIGACSLVTTDVPAYAIVAGNPARIIKHRNQPSISNWWEYPTEFLKKAILSLYK
jgi:acetyltransferase-like isoleucine patch superfamily enzyme